MRQIEDLKSFFEEDDEEEGAGMEDGSPYSSPVPSNTDMLLLSAGSPMSKREMLSLLPSRPDTDRLVRRYFGASSPTQSRWCLWKGFLVVVLMMCFVFSRRPSTDVFKTGKMIAAPTRTLMLMAA